MITKAYLRALLHALGNQTPESYDQNTGGVGNPCGCLVRTAALGGLPDPRRRPTTLSYPQHLYLFASSKTVLLAAAALHLPAPEPMGVEAAKVRIRALLEALP